MLHDDEIFSMFNVYKTKLMFFVFFSLTPTRVVPVVGGVSDGEFGIKLFSFSSGHLLLI